MSIIRCERCGEILKPEKVIWLEFSNTDSNYYVQIPKKHISQGLFSFGSKCAINQLKETTTNLENETLPHPI
ncbi:MAG: hypothetical protein WC554_01880 [Clostridia bacterium]